MSTVARHVSKLSGYAPAVPTPFDDDGNVDIAAFEHFCERQIREGATALVVCGTTGEVLGARLLAAIEIEDVYRTAPNGCSPLR